MVCVFFVAASQGIPLDCLALVVRGPYDLGSHRTITIEETVLGWLPPQGTAQTAA